MIKFIKPEDLTNELKNFSANMAVTYGQFEIDVPSLLEDMEWNHMDQLHRPYIHNTYQEAIRLAFGNDFAVSLTRWGRWPFFITVSDVRIKPGLFYQSMTLAGIFFVHLIISMSEANEIVHLKAEWYITSHKLFKFLHKILSKKFYKLNERLQIEDNQIRSHRYALRKKGYKFGVNEINYYHSNLMRHNTIYPALPLNAAIQINNLSIDEMTTQKLGELDFLIKRTHNNHYLLWPAACPHEGGNLALGKPCANDQIQCPWHGLRFSAVNLSAQESFKEAYGFEFELREECIYIRNKGKIACFERAVST